MEICPCCNREKTSLEIKKMRLKKKLDQIKEEREILEKNEAKRKKIRNKRKKRNEKKHGKKSVKQKKSLEKILSEEDEIVNRFSQTLKNTTLSDEKIILSEEIKSSIIKMLESFN